MKNAIAPESQSRVESLNKCSWNVLREHHKYLSGAARGMAAGGTGGGGGGTAAETSIISAKVEATVGEQKQREKYYASRIKSNLTHRLQCVKAAQGGREREREGEEGGGENTLQRRLAECALNASPSLLLALAPAGFCLVRCL